MILNKQRSLLLMFAFFLMGVFPGLTLAKGGGFEPPSDGAPGRREDAGSRPFCAAPTGSFLALIPATNLGKTVSERPTFWLYVPYASGSVEFVLEDEISKKVVTKTTFDVKNGPGIISYQPPEKSPVLEVGKKYRWRFFFFCNPASQADVLSVNGVIIRESLNAELNNQLTEASAREKVSLYGDNGYWYEMLTEVIKLRQLEPNNAEIHSIWSNFLQHPLVRLERVISAPVVDCCLPEGS
ncbi:DUF928 domain-containing protein [Ancylothrix sp. C2]|uniref:DUF928 domain-containing protein n=1 Tax=Ancylothrix sp. D3o TaxID=2953691 RepID=UPI0021BA9553|nr:DUF928 domain-containing protein [Ancylothrix sp. D3o]MCT7952932.1 DUF928 domain-containing protein [Ancylothrix sp. D3o]